MSVQVKRRRDSAANLATFVGAQAELLVDITNNRVIVHDGVTPGGWAAAKLSEVSAPTRRTVADANTTVTPNDRLVGFSSLSAPRVVTLCAASAFPAGTTLAIVDESGACSSANTITINRAGADAISGQLSAALNGAYMSILLESNGVNAWTRLGKGLNETFNLVGVATPPDPSNALSVYGTSALFNSGSSFSFTINKSGAASTGSILFQDGFSARAQIGLLGNDNFSFKVSPNGSSFVNAILIDAATGAPSFANQRTPVSDAAYSVLPTDRVIAFNAITAARNVTLPAASAFPSGHRLLVIDESGACSAINTISVTRSGSDTINGAATALISAAFGSIELESNGATAWTSVYGANFSNSIVAPAGTSSLAPIRMQAGATLSAAFGGALEYDGAVFYSTVAANERGVVPSEQFQIISAAYTLTAQTTAQKLLNGTTNGALTLAAGTYQFECAFSLSALSATSGSFGFALGGTAVISQSWQGSAIKPATLATASAPSVTYNVAANAALVAANTSTFGAALIRGTLRVTSAGSVIPQVSLSIAAAAIIGANSYFKISPLGASGAAAVGNWS